MNDVRGDVLRFSLTLGLAPIVGYVAMQQLSKGIQNVVNA